MVLLREQTEQELANKYVEAVARRRRQLGLATAAGVNQLVRFMNEARNEIKLRLQTLIENPNAPFSARLAPAAAEEIGSALAILQNNIDTDLAERLGIAFDLGEAITAASLIDAGINLSVPTVSPEILTSASRISANLMSDLISDLGQRIAARIRLGTIGLVSSSQLITEVDNMLRTSREVRRGLRRRIGTAFQAESIVRTEMGRAFSSAQQAASEAIAETIPGLRKTWVTVKGDRRGHREAEARYAEGGEVGPILITEQFLVQDFSRVGVSEFFTFGGNAVRTKPHAREGQVVTDRMMHPRDPSASAANNINCTCVTLDVVPDFGAATQRARGIIQEVT